MTALATASLAVVAWIIARIAFASGSRGKSGLTAIAAPPTHRFSSVYVAGSRSTVTRTGLVRIAVRPGSQAGSAAAPRSCVPSSRRLRGQGAAVELGVRGRPVEQHAAPRRRVPLR